MARTSYLWTFVFAAALLAVSGWVYRELLLSVYGPFDATGAPVVRAFDDGGRIALLDSRTTASVHAARAEDGLNPAWFEGNLRTWEAFLSTVGARYEVLSDDQMDRLDAFDLLVLPSTTALSDAQIEAVKVFLQSGRSVFATWMPGVYRADGSWRGYEFIETTFGVQADAFGADAFTNFRVYADTFPGLARPGLYRPAEGGATSDFAPLSGYAWSAPLGAERPAAHFALADTLTRRTASGREPVTAVRYFTWLGGDAASAAEAARAETPFQRITFVAGTPLSAHLPAAFRMKTGTYDAPLSVRAVEPRTRAAAFRYDFAASDLPAEDAMEGSAAAVYGTYGDGRFVFLGHELSAMGFDPTEQSALAQVFENALRWLGRAPIAWVAPWPQGHERAAALSLLPDASGRPPEALLAAIRDLDLVPTVFVDAESPSVPGRLGRAELGVLGDAALPSGALRSARERFAQAAGSDVTAFRARSGGALPEHAAVRLAEAGFSHAFADTLGRAFDPDLAAERRLVVLPRTARTDRDLLARSAAPETARALLRDDRLRVAAEGGLYTLALHADGLGQADYLPVLRETLAALREDGFWMPSGSELATWIQARHGIQTDVRRRGPRRVHLRVSNTNGHAAQGVAIHVALGQAVAEAAVRSELVGTPDPEAFLSDDATVLTLHLDTLAPGQYRTFQVDFVPMLPEPEAAEDALAAR